MTDTDRHSGDPLKVANAYFRLVAMGCESTIAFWSSNPPDPKAEPVTFGMVAAYLSRLEFQSVACRDGFQAILELTRNHPTLHSETQELSQWLLSREPTALHPQHTSGGEDVIGDHLVETMGFSFAHAKEILGKWKTPPKGAPNKRGHTLRMLDARVAKGWSYAYLASKMCDCELRTHDHHCRERIRKRIKELEGVLLRYGIPCVKKRRK